jgi:hypothetical protein
MIRDKLFNKFLEELENNQVQYNEYETLPDGSVSSYVKDEYLYMSIEDQCDYLGMPEWVTEWTLDLIRAEEGIDGLSGQEEYLALHGRNMPGSEVI